MTLTQYLQAVAAKAVDVIEEDGLSHADAVDVAFGIVDHPTFIPADSEPSSYEYRTARILTAQLAEARS